MPGHQWWLHPKTRPTSCGGRVAVLGRPCPPQQRCLALVVRLPGGPRRGPDRPAALPARSWPPRTPPADCL